MFVLCVAFVCVARVSYVFQTNPRLPVTTACTSSHESQVRQTSTVSPIKTSNSDYEVFGGDIVVGGDPLLFSFVVDFHKH